MLSLDSSGTVKRWSSIDFQLIHTFKLPINNKRITEASINHRTDSVALHLAGNKEVQVFSIESES